MEDNRAKIKHLFSAEAGKMPERKQTNKNILSLEFGVWH
jgi:hypothetical protein